MPIFKVNYMIIESKSRDYKEKRVDRKKRKVFVTAHVILRTAAPAMFLASALNRGVTPGNIQNGVTNTGGKYLCYESLSNADETLTNADESRNESPYAFLTEHFSLCSFYSLIDGTGAVSR